MPSIKKRWVKEIKKERVKIASEMANLGAEMKYMQEGVAEIQSMGQNSEFGFTFNNVSGNQGGADFDSSNKNIIVMDISGGSISNGIHEASHGYDLSKNGTYTRDNYLSGGEGKAYSRQYSYNPQSLPNSYWGRISTINDITNNWILGIQNNGEFLYGKFVLGNKYSFNRVKTILDENKKSGQK